jgi:type II secretory pathway pseudopilin PulG
MRRVDGFTYVGLLLAIAIAGAVLAAVGTLWSTESRREREVDLLFAGDQFRQAIGAYYAQAPAGQPHKFPSKLDDLLNDKRWPTTHRHLRKIFVDPITGTREWVLVRAADQTIIGVHSASEEAPIKQANFPDEYTRFESAKTYRDWQFVWTQTAAPGAQGATPAVPAVPAIPANPANPSNPANPLLPTTQPPANPGAGTAKP